MVLVTVALGAAVAQGFGRFTYGVVLPEVRDDLLSGSNTLAGLLGTANTFAYLAGALLVAAAANRMAPVTMVRSGLVLSVSGLGLASLAPNGIVLGVALVLMGLGGAAIWIPSPGLATAAVSDKWRGVAVGLMGSGVGIGIVFSGQLHARVVDAGRSWQTVYAVETGLGLVTIVLAAWALGRRGAAKPTGPARSGFGGFGVLSKMTAWKPVTICYALYGFGYLLVVAFLVARLTDDSGFTDGEAGTMFTLLGACVIVGGVAFGRVSDRVGRRRALALGFGSYAASTLLILVGDPLPVALGVIGVGINFSGTPTVIAAYIVDQTDTTTYGPSYAAATFAFGVAQVSAPQVGGALADWRGSFTAVFVLSAMVMSIGAVVALQLPPDHRKIARDLSG